MNPTALTAEPVYYEVLWGIEDTQRQTWVDYGDGMAASKDAAVNAGRLLLGFAKHGHKAALFVDGIFKAGHDFAEEWAAFEADQAAVQDVPVAAAPGDHKTRTVPFARVTEPRLNWSNMKTVYDRSAMARCSCGWFEAWGTREAARRAARNHRADQTD